MGVSFPKAGVVIRLVETFSIGVPRHGGSIGGNFSKMELTILVEDSFHISSPTLVTFEAS